MEKKDLLLKLMFMFTLFSNSTAEGQLSILKQSSVTSSYLAEAASISLSK